MAKLVSLLATHLSLIHPQSAIQSQSEIMQQLPTQTHQKLMKYRYIVNAAANSLLQKSGTHIQMWISSTQL
jgi:hypothetical protein